MAIQPLNSVRVASPGRRKRKYRGHFLEQVIARIDFAAPISIPVNGPPKSIIEAVRQQFPVPERKKTLARSITVTPKGTQETRQQKDEWLYHSKDRRKNTKLTDGVLLVEYKQRSYDSFEGLKSDFIPVVNAVFSAFPDLQVQRLGLRYINKIDMKDEPKPTHWSRYLNRKLLAIFALADDQDTISRAFHLLEFNYGDTNLRFQYGMENPDYPARIRRKIFTLDYDSYCTLLLSVDEIPGYLDSFHCKIKDSFEEVIMDPLRRKMSVVHGR